MPSKSKIRQSVEKGPFLRLGNALKFIQFHSFNAMYCQASIKEVGLICYNLNASTKLNKSKQITHQATCKVICHARSKLPSENAIL